MSRRVFNISIAGCGKVAHLHAKAILGMPNARLAAVWSRTPGTADQFADLYHTVAYRDIKSMVRSEKIDLVIVCTPHPYHIHPAVEAAQAGASILVEKPLASDLSDCDRIIEACSLNNVRLGVISQRRWYEPVLRVRDAIVSGKVGKPVLATVTMLGWRDKAYYDSDAWRGTWKDEGGGVLVNQAPHQLDLLLWFMGGIEEVFGIWGNLNHPYIEVEDTAVAVIRFRSGAMGNIVVSNSQKPGIYGKVHVHGDNGASVGVQTDGGAMFIAGMTGVTEPPVNDIWTVPGEEHLLKQWVQEDTLTFRNCDPTVKYLGCQLEDYLIALEKGTEPSVDGLAGRRTVELFTAIYYSGNSRKPVKFPLTADKKFEHRPLYG